MHAWRMVQNEICIQDYSALVAVGGDGTLHEVVNGLLSRPDKLKVPLALIPNGSGNDTCFAFGIDTVEKAL
jgi:diacylglycerol kinase family enzyme